jgi:sarcosine oxidase
MAVNGAAVRDPAPLPAAYGAATPPLALPTLRGDAQADCAIVGGGITGVSAALHLARAGRSVVLLEAREIGWGGSGRAFGQVVPYTRLAEARVLRLLGEAAGLRLLAATAEAPAYVRHLIEMHGIACEAVHRGLIFAAHCDRARASLATRQAFWSARGVPVALLEHEALMAETGTRLYGAGLLDPRGFTLDPLAYTRGLARAARAAGAALYESSRARRLVRDGDAWRVETDGGEVRARGVVLATDAYTDGLWPGLARRVMALRGHHLVSAPLGAADRARVLPGGQALTDTRRLYSGVRLRPDGRLHVSVPGPAFTAEGTADPRAATARVAALFPWLPPPRWEEAVSGWVAMSGDQLPHVDRLAPGLFAAIGLSGRGIALGTMLGREVAGRLTLGPPSEWALPDRTLPALPPGPVLRAAAHTLHAVAALRDGRELRQR